jgi:hypothetical protein
MESRDDPTAELAGSLAPDKRPASARKPGGILITRSLRVAIPPGGFSISINDQGEIASKVDIHVSLDVSDHWLWIAMHHVDEGNVAKANLELVWPSGDDSQAIPLLENEFVHGMQSVAAAAFALDAFYGQVKECAPVPKDVTEAWNNNRTSRHARLAESFRRAFDMGPKSAAQLRTALAVVFALRGLTVHPPATIAAAVWHPRLEVGMEWRFVRFRVEEAQGAAGFALSLLWQLAHRPKAKFVSLVDYCRGAIIRFDPILKEWESKYGQLFDHAPFEPPESAP